MNPQKDEIADQFKRHFEHYGYKKTSVDEIARELKISKKTIYQHFNKKEEIFYYIVSRVAQQYMQRMKVELEGLPSQRDKLENLVRKIFSESRKWLRENDAFEFRYKYDIARLAFTDAYNDLLADIVHAGMESGEFRQASVELNVRFINGIISESMQIISKNPEIRVEDEVVKAIERLLI